MIARCVPPALLALTALLLAACREPEVKTYRVEYPNGRPSATQPPAASASPDASSRPAAAAANAPAGSTPPSAPGGSMANTPVATASGAALTWTAPVHWQPKSGSAMRKGSYAITAEGIAGEADLSITAFPGDVGGDLANLNRWRGQLQLPPITQGEFDAATQHLDRNDLHLTVVDIAGTGSDGKPWRTLGAMVPFGGATWFFKLMGPDAIVAKEKAAFTTFLDTIKPAAQ